MTDGRLEYSLRAPSLANMLTDSSVNDADGWDVETARRSRESFDVGFDGYLPPICTQLLLRSVGAQHLQFPPNMVE